MAPPNTRDPEGGDDPSLAAFIKDTRTPFQRFMDAKSPVKQIEDFRGSAGRWEGFTFGLRALTVDEVQHAAVDAVKELTGKFGMSESLLFTSVSEEMRDISSKVHILYRALVDATAPHERLFPTPDKLRAALEPDELHGLFEMFMDWQRERSPLSSAQNLDAVLREVEALGKGMAPPSVLNGCDAGTLRYIVTVLAQEKAARLTASMSEDSSSTSPPNASEEFSVKHSGYSAG